MSVLSWELSSESHILLCPSPLTILSVYPPCPRPPVCYIISLSDCGQLSPTSPEGPRKSSPPPLDTSVTRHLLYFQAEWFDLSMSCLLSSMQNPLPKFPLSGLFFCQMSSGFIPSPPQVSAQKSPYPRPFLTSLHKCPQPLTEKNKTKHASIQQISTDINYLELWLELNCQHFWRLRTSRHF